MNTNEWKLLAEFAASRNEPLYVTPAEYRELQGMETERQRDEWRSVAWARSLEARLLGTPVVVDAAKAIEQRS